MVKQRILQFPQGFLWGTASSAHQYEGGNTNNQWYKWEQQGRILTGEQSGEAINWWQDAERDFDLAEQLENNALRLSIEWSRIEPEEGKWNETALERYRAMLLDLRRLRLRPLLTLHHFTDPLWFAERGGFARESNVHFFVRYATHVVRSLHDLCDFWITFNEPNVYATEGYVRGTFPPGEQNLIQGVHVLRNMMLAHVETFYALRRVQPEANIGYCLHYRLFDPANPLSPLDRSAAALQERAFNWAVLEAGETGNFGFPINAIVAPIPHAAGARDFHGINYYTREMVRFDPTRAQELFGRRFVKPGAIRNDPGRDNIFGEIYPRGMYRVLVQVYRRTHGNKPMYITENGFNDMSDERRPRAILEHLAMVHRAIREGVPVKGYFYWSLLDNFEWNEGWGTHFGLIEYDPLSKRRIPRRSASMYGEICRANAITEKIVERYAPDAMEAIFGPEDKASQQLPV